MRVTIGDAMQGRPQDRVVRGDPNPDPLPNLTSLAAESGLPGQTWLLGCEAEPSSQPRDSLSLEGRPRDSFFGGGEVQLSGQLRDSFSFVAFLSLSQDRVGGAGPTLGFPQSARPSGFGGWPNPSGEIERRPGRPWGGPLGAEGGATPRSLRTARGKGKKGKGRGGLGFRAPRVF